MRRIDDDTSASQNQARSGSDQLPCAGKGPVLATAGPPHVAIIMDGNGRWASARKLPRLAGHRRGVDSVRAIVEACPDLGIEYLTLYAFSTENWKRPMTEVSGLMHLFRIYLQRESAQLNREGVRVRFIGDPMPLPPDIQRMMRSLEETTRHNVRLTVSIAINYGGRAEMVNATRRLAAKVAAGEMSPVDIDENALRRELFTEGLPDPDLIIRTSGEQRLSNFLLWQAAYSELVFAPELWPDFDREAFARSLARYDGRNRRYGAVAG